jgi:invasion protein IalB
MTMKTIPMGAMAGVLLACTTALAQQPPADPGRPESKNVGDWTVRCFPVQSPSPCDMFQEEDSQSSHQRVVSLSLAYVPSLDRHAFQISVPLDVALQRGMTIQTDSYTSPVFRYRRCDRSGCYVEAPVDNGLVAGLSKSGPDAKIIIVGDNNGKTYPIKFSLKGFAAAHDDMVAQARAKAKTAAPSGDAAAAPAATP